MATGQAEVKPSNGVLGAEVSGVDWGGGVEDDTIAMLRRAWLDHQVLIFRKQELSPERLIALGRAFGDLEVVETFSGLSGHPQIMPLVKEATDTLNVGEGWHIDSTYRECPPAGAVLYSVDVPPVGGDTLFASMYAAHEALSPGMKRLVGGLRMVHANGYLGDAAALEDRRSGLAMPVRTDVRVRTAEHPLVTRHPETGRSVLFVNGMVADGGMTSHLVDMTAEESAPVIRYLCAHASRAEFTLRVEWEPGMVVLYDNRCLQHNAPNDYQGHRREMWRLSLAGGVPAGHPGPGADPTGTER
ncbi:TauD/TfdA dioxygenase family protein [Pseudonocardia xishanensis]|uniref:TauD/TfdA family dioxygenase n=1 Tax=Pseudonocardia xishanensis TaxID=630995 RepID=A0ABP8RGK1_9PSEU